MNIFERKPALRWLAPVAIVAVVAGGGGVYATATADARLPKISPQTLLTRLQQAKVDALSGTVTQDSDLGLPALPGVGGSRDASLSSLISGTHTLDVWYSGPDKSRLRVRGAGDESDVIVNGTDVWNWSYKDKTATHRTLKHPTDQRMEKASADLPKTPQEAAKRALDAVEPTTEVSTDGTGKVAGRAVYELVLEPKDTQSLVKQVRIAVDGEKFIPLQVEIVDSANKPAFKVRYTSIDFNRPEDRQFVFQAPPGTKVTEAAKSGPKGDKAHRELAKGHGKPSAADQPKIYGKGWASIAVSKMDVKLTGGADSEFGQVLDRLPRTPDGTGRVLKGTLFSAVLTDDGRVAVGSVPAELLYDALEK